MYIYAYFGEVFLVGAFCDCGVPRRLVRMLARAEFEVSCTL